MRTDFRISRRILLAHLFNRGRPVLFEVGGEREQEVLVERSTCSLQGPARVSGIGAPKGTPAAIIDKLNSNITAGLADPQLKARIKGLGADPMPMTPTQFGALLGDETEKWAKVVKFAGIKP